MTPCLLFLSVFLPFSRAQRETAPGKRRDGTWGLWFEDVVTGLLQGVMLNLNTASKMNVGVLAVVVVCSVWSFQYLKDVGRLTS